MQSENHSISNELFHLVTRYRQAIKRDEPYEKVFPILKAIKEKKQELNNINQKENTAAGQN